MNLFLADGLPSAPLPDISYISRWPSEAQNLRANQFVVKYYLCLSYYPVRLQRQEFRISRACTDEVDLSFHYLVLAILLVAATPVWVL